jgi:hypothetical protein
MHGIKFHCELSPACDLQQISWLNVRFYCNVLYCNYFVDVVKYLETEAVQISAV